MGYVLYVILDASHVAFGTFGLFVAVSFCITAFPVLARILTEKHLTTSAVCSCALSCWFARVYLQKAVVCAAMFCKVYTTNIKGY